MDRDPHTFRKTARVPCAFLAREGRCKGWARSFSDRWTATDFTMMGGRSGERLTRIAGRDVSRADGHTVGRTLPREVGWVGSLRCAQRWRRPRQGRGRQDRRGTARGSSPRGRARPPTGPRALRRRPGQNRADPAAGGGATPVGDRARPRWPMERAEVWGPSPGTGVGVATDSQ